MFPRVIPCLMGIVCTTVLTAWAEASDVEPIAPIEAPFEMPALERPVFPSRTFDIRDYGAVDDGVTTNTAAFAEAIAACAQAGGGRVLVPAGTWLTGPIHLESNVELHLAAGSELRFSDRFDDYLPAVFISRGGVECYTYSPLIYARDCENIAITGSGTLNGQGQAWWPWKSLPGISQLFEMGAKGIPVEKRVFDNEEGVRPPFIQPINCRNVLMEGFTLVDGPSWNIHPVYCENLIIRRVTINSHGPNNDGIDPESCRNVLIEHCFLDCGDDCFTIKAGRDEDAWRVGRPCENIVIRHCETRGGHGGVVIGSEMSAGVRNVFAHDCRFDGTDRGIRLKSQRGRGGIVENVWVQDIVMDNIVLDAININLIYTGKRKPAEEVSKATPLFRNIHIRNVTCHGAREAATLYGLPEMPLQGISIENADITSTRGMRCADIEGLELSNVTLSIEEGPAILLDDVRGADIRGLGCSPAPDELLRIDGTASGNITPAPAKAPRDTAKGKEVE